MFNRHTQGAKFGLLASAIPAIFLPGAGAAQDAASKSADTAAQHETTGAAGAPAVEELVVSGSRIARDGFQQPTPVTVVGREEVERAMPATLVDYVSQMPGFGAAVTSSNATLGLGGSGRAVLNLRHLTTGRTLVLLDNRRVVSSAIEGGVDVNTLPTTLIERVEVVTGGASAAWGADAVAGVVNFVLNHNFEGFEVNAQTGVGDEGDYGTNKLQLTYGQLFANGRGSVVASAEYYRAPDIIRARDRDWWKSYALVLNPAYAQGNNHPRLITVSHVGAALVTSGGLITEGPLRGVQFVGSAGTPVAFDFGNLSSLQQWGADTDSSFSAKINLVEALTYGTAFVHGRYDISDRLTLYTEASYGNTEGFNETLQYYRNGNLTIQSDNAFLDPGIRARMNELGLTSFRMGKQNNDYPWIASRNERELMRGVLGAQGEIGKGWRWNAYYQRGDVKVDTVTPWNTLVPRYNLAVDAVRDPSTGAIVCRSTLTDPTNGCVPFNVFGDGVASPEAIEYVAGTPGWQKIDLQQDVVSAELTGDVFSLPAGAVSIAVGAEYIEDQAVATQDDFSAARQFYAGNYQPFAGSVRTTEYFGETVLPLLKDLPLVKSLELNAAARVTDYSTSGEVTTWKIGVGHDVTDDLRLRVTRSRDIRAPTLFNLFSTGATGTQTIADPVTGQAYTFLANTAGNPDLEPEVAKTWTGGVIYRPSWLPGLGLSIDYYDISIAGAITSLNATETLRGCVDGQTDLCDRVIRDPAGAILRIDLLPSNVALLTTSGWDIEAVYRHGLGSGLVMARALATYVNDLTTTSPTGVEQQIAGALGREGGSGIPKLKLLSSVTYDQGPLSATMTVRVQGSAKLNNAWGPLDVDDNTVPSVAYLDLAASYGFELNGVDYRLSLTVDNALDQDPPAVPWGPEGGSILTANNTRPDLYDVIGRRYKLGLNAKF